MKQKKGIVSTSSLLAEIKEYMGVEDNCHAQKG
jgi:hypothetical protein